MQFKSVLATAMAAGMAAAGASTFTFGCSTDPCTQLADKYAACNPTTSSTSSSTTGGTTSCTGSLQTVSQCILNLNLANYCMPSAADLMKIAQCSQSSGG